MRDVDTTQELGEAVIGKPWPKIAAGFSYSPPQTMNPLHPLIHHGNIGGVRGGIFLEV